MNREEKIKLLMGLKSGKIKIEDLRQPQVHVFIYIDNKPGYYEMKGKEYSEKEYLEFCKNFENKNNNSVFRGSKNQLIKEDIIIKVIPINNTTSD